MIYFNIRGDILKNSEKKHNLRRVKWIFSKSGISTLALEHFLAMVPATILVPILVNQSMGANIIDISLVLFTSGLGTIIFSFCSGRKEIAIDSNGNEIKVTKRIPAYLGSSFAYIGLTIYLLQAQTAEGIEPGTAYLYTGWSYIFSGVLLILLSFLYKIKLIEKFFSLCLPATVIGPAISLIGLELADTAVVDSGLDTANMKVDTKALSVSLVTLLVIIILSLVKRKSWKNTAIIFGMLAGYGVHIILNGFPSVNWSDIDWFTLPNFRIPLLVFPPNWQRLLISVIPATLIVFTENIGRVTVINRMQQEDDGDAQLFNVKSVKIMERALFAHGCASVAATLIGSVPNTLYAENIAVMGIHKTADTHNEPDKFIRTLMNPFSVMPYRIAAAIAIIFSFIGPLQDLLLGIPKPVIGGMELFLFGIISAPGIQLLVEQRVNYKKVSNQLITAAVLIAGISEISLDFKWFELKGMSLGLVVGFTLNLIVLLFKRMGVLCDPLSLDEVLSSCLPHIPDEKNISAAISKSLMDVNSVSVTELKKAMSGYEGAVMADKETQAEFLRETVIHSSEIFLKNEKTVIRISQNPNCIKVDIRKDVLPEDDVSIYLHDYQDAIDIESYVDINDINNQSNVEFLSINLSRHIPLHMVQRLIKTINW